MRRFLMGLGLATALLLTACAGSRQSGVCGDLNPPSTAEGDADALVAEGEESWQLRSDQAQLRTAISSWSQALLVDPSRADLRVKLARAQYFLADGFLRFDETKFDEMLDNFEAATNQAEFALAQKYPAYRAKHCSKQGTEIALAQLDEGASGAMYWYASALGKYALAKSIVTVLNEKDRIKAMMGFIHKRDPGYFHQGPDRYFGAFYTKIPFPKGDLPRSRRHFEASLAKAPIYLATRVLLAEMYAIKAQDRALFEKMLNEVVAFDLQQAPDLIPENTIEQRKAKALLEEIDVYFPEG